MGGTSAITNDHRDLLQVADYYPFGSLRFNSQYAEFNERKKFTGYEYDSSTGLNYAGARYQQPSEGRFVSQDPLFIDSPERFLSDPQQMNAYAYARNNPLRYVDPNGEEISLAGIQKQLDSIKSQALAIQQQISQLQTSVGTAVNNYSQGSGVANRAVDVLTRDRTAAYVAGGVGVAAAGGAGIIAGGAALGIQSLQTAGYSCLALCPKASDLIGQNYGSLGTVIQNAPGVIRGFNHDGTYHGLDQIISRGVSPQALLNTVRDPLVSFSSRFDRVGYLSREAHVVLDKTGQVVTAWTNNQFGSTITNILNNIK
ncbi:MAG: hypothetical protein A3C84_02720 [Candidatus Ryanbacteria bacterium RIFCSPHIGHO2_02_FULL_48_12]|uniref:RHS repeat-associated core domain-containing protein n=1 Tax=Candidatus Ryanbacteria bacterium RIFCSPHIGHO2_01_FULL_48_27 TaxID=1802115 RepID=A0A1G2G5R9_9BACT|nr:MAG: hypothetical protein A2756_01195 [Candidatus Ryanbacteria bacterium RIFCSPHIGHO2_01_FULL_48_27]OGZ49019.1 MAG: hypothetical protein A3C84_02720 [Candidatus Ryanbacteria bacterium RIFCSPHIGHO2_02_FULL_48_12]